MGFFDKVKDLAVKNADKVDAAIDKVGDVVDQKTGEKYKDKVDKAQDAAKKLVADSREAAQEPDPGPADQPPTQPPGQSPTQPPGQATTS